MANSLLAVDDEASSTLPTASGPVESRDFPFRMRRDPQFFSDFVLTTGTGTSRRTIQGCILS